MLKSVAVPVFGIGSYPLSRPAGAFHAQRLEDLRAEFDRVDRPHAHDFYMLLYITAGSGTHTIDFVTYPVRPNSLFFLTPGQVHTWQLTDATRGYVVFFTPEFYLLHNPGERLYTYPFFSAFQPPVLYLAPDELQLPGLVELLYGEHVAPAQGQEAVVGAALHLLLELAARYHPHDTHGAARPGVQRLRAFEQLLDRHFRTHRGVAHYAGALRLTPNHLNALCRQLLQKSARDLIHARVVVEARRLLTHSGQSVAEVAYALGFDDSSYFGRYFRKYTGQTPEAFRGGRLNR